MKIPVGNFYNKYETKNSIELFLVNRFITKLQDILRQFPFEIVYEIGSGEGYILHYLCEVSPGKIYLGSDIDINLIQKSKKEFPEFHWLVNSASNIPVAGHEIDFVVACEVMEHLQEPEIFLQECVRMHAKFYLFTVPNEPLWRILNMLRFRYLKELGNTPGHVNHWTKREFTELVSRYLRIKEICLVQPWIFLLAEEY